MFPKNSKYTILIFIANLVYFIFVDLYERQHGTEQNAYHPSIKNYFVVDNHSSVNTNEKRNNSLSNVRNIWVKYKMTILQEVCNIGGVRASAYW